MKGSLITVGVNIDHKVGVAVAVEC